MRTKFRSQTMLRILSLVAFALYFTHAVETEVLASSNTVPVHDPRYRDDEYYKFNVRTAIPAVHPAIRPLENEYKASRAMNAKFRCVEIVLVAMKTLILVFLTFTGH